MELTFGGRPLFLGMLGVDEPAAGADAVPLLRLFLLPFGRPRPRLAGVGLLTAADSVKWTGCAETLSAGGE